MRLLSLLLLVACTGSTDPEPVLDSEVEGVDDTEEPVEVDLLDDVEIAELTEAAERFAQEVVALDFVPLFEMLADFETSTDRNCPGEDASPRGGGIHHDCTTDDGVRVWGRYVWLDDTIDLLVAVVRDTTVESWLQRFDPTWDPDSPLTVDAYVGVDGNFVMDRGFEQLEYSGEFFDLALRAGDIDIRTRAWLGPLAHPGAAPDSWIARGLVPDLHTTWMGDGTQSFRGLLGGLSGLTEAWPAAHANDLVMMTGPGRCDSEPEGTLGLRDAEGEWVDLLFGEACDGCATVTRGGIEVGTVCPDMSELMIAPADVELP